MAVTAKSLKCVYATNEGSQKTITLKNFNNDEIELSTLTPVANLVVSMGIFNVKGVNLVSLKEAYLEQTVVTELE